MGELASLIVAVAALVTAIGGFFKLYFDLRSVAQVANKTHVLVNSNMGIQLRLNAELSSWKANQTGDPRDAEASRKADQLLAEHDQKQRTVDSMEADDS